METPKKSGSSILPFAIGAAAGAAVGYLIASGKGKEVYNQLKNYAGKASDKASDLADDLKDRATDTLNKAKEQAGEFRDRAKDVIDKAKETGNAAANGHR